MKYNIRQAKSDDVLSAFKLGLRVFTEFDAPEFEPDAAAKFRADCTENADYIENYKTGRHLMFIAVIDNEIAGLVNERGSGHISMLFVDGRYQRQGIATKLTERIVCELKLKGINLITVNSSPYGLRFYENFGFTAAGTEQKKDGFIFTSMVYRPLEIWDILDENGGRTGRHIERGRRMSDGDYNLIVHVWKHNSKGEWLIDKRTNRGTDLDGKWETTGGAAIAGEGSLTAALREAKEELGIGLDPGKGTMFRRNVNHKDNRGSWFTDAWIFEYNGPIEAVHLQKEEACDAMWATVEQINGMMESGEFVSKKLYPYFDEMAEKWKAK